MALEQVGFKQSYYLSSLILDSISVRQSMQCQVCSIQLMWHTYLDIVNLQATWKRVNKEVEIRLLRAFRTSQGRDCLEIVKCAKSKPNWMRKKNGDGELSRFGGVWHPMTKVMNCHKKNLSTFWTPWSLAQSSLNNSSKGWNTKAAWPKSHRMHFNKMKIDLLRLPSCWVSIIFGSRQALHEKSPQSPS